MTALNSQNHPQIAQIFTDMKNHLRESASSVDKTGRPPMNSQDYPQMAQISTDMKDHLRMNKERAHDK